LELNLQKESTSQLCPECSLLQRQVEALRQENTLLNEKNSRLEQKNKKVTQIPRVETFENECILDSNGKSNVLLTSRRKKSLSRKPSIEKLPPTLRRTFIATQATEIDNVCEQ